MISLRDSFEPTTLIHIITFTSLYVITEYNDYNGLLLADVLAVCVVVKGECSS